MKVVSIAAAAALLLSSALAAASDAPQAMLSRLHAQATSRIDLGDLVRVRGSQAAVTTFAATVADDQRHLDAAVLQYAKDNDITLEPMGLDPEAAQVGALEGPELDHRFLAYIIDSSATLVRDLEKVEGQGDPAYRRVLNHALSCYRDHRARADRLLRAVPQA
jgi:predicted outer membrane protein